MPYWHDIYFCGCCFFRVIENIFQLLFHTWAYVRGAWHVGHFSTSCQFDPNAIFTLTASNGSPHQNSQQSFGKLEFMWFLSGVCVRIRTLASWRMCVVFVQWQRLVFLSPSHTHTNTRIGCGNYAPSPIAYIWVSDPKNNKIIVINKIYGIH